MSLRAKRAGLTLLFFAMLCAFSLPGCKSSFYNLTWLVTEGTNYDGHLDYYVDKATYISYPDVSQKTDERAVSSQPPRTLKSRSKDEIWDLHLGDAIRLALKNSTFIRDRQQFLSPGNPILNNNAFAPSKLDIALQETNVVTGRRGVDAALADFDTRVVTSLIWGRNETVQNNRFISGGLTPGDVLTDETNRANLTADKQFANGGIFSVINDWNYSLNNIPSRLFGSTYTGSLRFSYTQPLWAASGTRFTRIAGHPGRDATTALNVDNGVVIARINGDISVADFELAVTIMLRDVETLYWDLYFAYQNYHSETQSRARAADIWSQTKDKAGTPGGETYQEAQARDNYYDAEDRAQNALADIYSTEQQLRRMLGLTVNDGKIIRPADALETTEFLPDWDSSLIEALTRRVELRKQKWTIKSLELQLEAARSLTRPRFDLVSEYGLNAFGDHLLAGSDRDGVSREGLNSALGTLTQGSHTLWNLGFRGSIPIGFRQARSQVRNIELRLAKARKGLSEQELEIGHELSSAFQQIDRWYLSARSNYNRRLAAKDRLDAFMILHQKDSNVLDAIVRAQFSLTQAEVSYLRSITEYNKSITELYYRMGAIFSRYNVILEEGEWDPQAYQDALRRAWSRTHAFDDESTLRTEPLEFEMDRSSPIEIPNTIDPGTIDPKDEMNFDKPGKILPPAPTIKETQLKIETKRSRRAAFEKKSGASTDSAIDLPLLRPSVHRETAQKNVWENVPIDNSNIGSTPQVFPRRPNYKMKPKQNESNYLWLRDSEKRDQGSHRWNIPTYPKPTEPAR